MIRLVLALLLALAMSAPYDPFRPAPPTLDRARLLRAGLDEGRVDALADEYEGLDYATRVDLNRWIASQPDEVIRDRYAEQQQTVVEQQPADAGEQQAADAPQEPQDAPGGTGAGEEPAGPTYEELNALTVDELDERIRAWNDAHPEQHLAIAGRKGEKIGRLLDAYDGEREAATQAPADAAPETAAPVADAAGEGTAPADAAVPTAPTPTATDGMPADAAPTPDATAVGTDTTGGTNP